MIRISPGLATFFNSTIIIIILRINAINRQLAINEDANHLRSLGDVFITEPKNAGKLMRRAKETTVNSKGKFNRKKRFVKSIKNVFLLISYND